MWFFTAEIAGDIYFSPLIGCLSFLHNFYVLGELAIEPIHNLLQEIWDEVGESDEQRDKMLLQLEQECLDVYKRKVELAAKSRAQLLQALSDGKLELSSLLSALGEKSSVGVVSIFSSYLFICYCILVHFKIIIRVYNG